MILMTLMILFSVNIVKNIIVMDVISNYKIVLVRIVDKMVLSCLLIMMILMIVIAMILIIYLVDKQHLKNLINISKHLILL
jgi:hypothetical protein